ncbi:hypothetical protein FOXG_18454 [Fusarium oxysporum f. sp. lycopersici 4287]|uniref:Uncharacterized protein n=4 Tax=Fusarium oxysporum TaxID=5507 RepID=W9I492_FUSOX|nr:hypothetical protein FOXG_18454 [Fusarium oxysporum f. sp. lycopersici 4287]EWY88085.1 hypothetical protein FOYG_09433 [Fusarium oxysporum NRRL 32931]EXK33884.1 hypothetical protein FOMG_11092 [Fusarium oxysporum f. sp. melonis 26406]KAJ0137759.1 actin [Fusarium oxysporum f. sp. albedinis]KAJ9420952.1 hypothetical protein QL093DRAFT_2100786 [Fusarium oxysporum]KAK2477612.1 hypothetical protein H9L39_10100 [Fusarium oxysporum f. sp. albedinis]
MGRMWRLRDVLCYEESRKNSQGAWDNKCLGIPKFTGPFFCFKYGSGAVRKAPRPDNNMQNCGRTSYAYLQ